jgi:hypothetical protein
MKHISINCAGLLTDGSTPARSKAAAILAAAAADVDDLVNLEFKMKQDNFGDDDVMQSANSSRP